MIITIIGGISAAAIGGISAAAGLRWAWKQAMRDLKPGEQPTTKDKVASAIILICFLLVAAASAAAGIWGH